MFDGGRASSASIDGGVQAQEKRNYSATFKFNSNG